MTPGFEAWTQVEKPDMTFDAALTWLLGHPEQLGRIGLVTLLVAWLAASIWWIWRRDREERREFKRRLSWIEEENRDCHAVLTTAMSTIAELLVMLKHIGGGRRQIPELADIEHKVDALRETLRQNDEKYKSWARDEARRRDGRL